MYQIETGIPLPSKSAGNTASVYPFADMQIGDSFAVPLTEDRKGAIARVSSAKTQYARRHKVKFSIRTTKDSMRVWRTA